MGFSASYRCPQPSRQTGLHPAAATTDPTPATTFMMKFPDLGEKYHIRLKPDAKLYALSTPRHVSLQLCPKVLARRAEPDGILGNHIQVDEPTLWCAGIGMVVVSKKSGKIRICVDLKLNHLTKVFSGKSIPYLKWTTPSPSSPVPKFSPS